MATGGLVEGPALAAAMGAGSGLAAAPAVGGTAAGLGTAAGGLGLTGALAPAAEIAAPFALSSGGGMGAMGAGALGTGLTGSMGGFGTLPSSGMGMSDMLRMGQGARGMMNQEQQQQPGAAPMQAPMPPQMRSFQSLNPYRR